MQDSRITAVFFLISMLYAGLAFPDNATKIADFNESCWVMDTAEPTLMDYRAPIGDLTEDEVVLSMEEGNRRSAEIGKHFPFAESLPTSLFIDHLRQAGSGRSIDYIMTAGFDHSVRGLLKSRKLDNAVIGEIRVPTESPLVLLNKENTDRVQHLAHFYQARFFINFGDVDRRQGHLWIEQSPKIQLFVAFEHEVVRLVKGFFVDEVSYHWALIPFKKSDDRTPCEGANDDLFVQDVHERKGDIIDVDHYE